MRGLPWNQRTDDGPRARRFVSTIIALVLFAAVTSNDFQKSGASRITTPDFRRPFILSAAVFFGIFLVLFSLSPLHFRQMGYMEEEFIAAKQVLWNITGMLKGVDVPLEVPRHGMLPVLIHVPFVALGRLLFGSSLEWQDMTFALEPLFLTAALLSLTFYWAVSRGSSGRVALILTLAAGFCTILWPYAYFGMEPAQSFFLLLAAFLGLTHRRVTWPAVLALAAASGFAASVKSTGVFLLPALAWVFWVYFRQALSRNPRGTIPKVLVSALVAGGIVLFSAWTRSLFWAPRGGTSPYLDLWLVRDPLTWLINVVSFLTSPNKGLFVYVPLALFAVVQLPSMIRRRSSLGIFTALVVSAVAFGYTLFQVWSDETFGPRYFHCAIAPLTLCIAAAYSGRERRLTRHAGFILAAVLGFFVAGLGASFGYGAMQTVATQTGQATLENFQGNLVWNHVRFNARLFLVWARGDETAYWTPSERWYFERPEGVPDPPSIELVSALDVNGRRIAVPQAFLIRTWNQSWGRIIRGGLVLSLLAGMAILYFVYRRTGSITLNDRSGEGSG